MFDNFCILAQSNPYYMKILFLFLALSFSLLAIDKPAYVLYNAKGKKVAYEKMLKDLRGQDIVLIGELHNNPISHWLELEITQALAEQRQLVLGAEMFERDNQLALTNYLQGKITAKGLDSSASPLLLEKLGINSLDELPLISPYLPDAMSDFNVEL